MLVFSILEYEHRECDTRYMTTQRKISLAVFALMIVCAIIFVIGDIGTRSNTGVHVDNVTAAVTSVGIEVAISGRHTTCEHISSWHQEQRGMLLSITPVVQRLPDTACDTQVVYTENVVVPSDGLVSGTYTIDVSGIISYVNFNHSIPESIIDSESLESDILIDVNESETNY